VKWDSAGASVACEQMPLLAIQLGPQYFLRRQHQPVLAGEELLAAVQDGLEREEHEALEQIVVENEIQIEVLRLGADALLPGDEGEALAELLPFPCPGVFHPQQGSVVRPAQFVTQCVTLREGLVDSLM
jgi:hypothetical protein